MGDFCDLSAVHCDGDVRTGSIGQCHRQRRGARVDSLCCGIKYFVPVLLSREWLEGVGVAAADRGGDELDVEI